MRLKHIENNVLANNVKLTPKEFKEVSKYFYHEESNELLETHKIDIYRKISIYHITFHSKDGRTENYKIHPKYNSRSGYSDCFTKTYDDKNILVYETKEKFVEDIMKSNEADFRILDNYLSSYEKKKENMKTVLELIEKLKLDVPELLV